MVFNSIEAFQQGHKDHGPEIWQQYTEFSINILDLHAVQCISDTFALKRCMRMIQSHLKPGLGQNENFGRIESNLLACCRENDLDLCSANKFTNQDGAVITKG